jgi:hypothetical protein
LAKFIPYSKLVFLDHSSTYALRISTSLLVAFFVGVGWRYGIRGMCSQFRLAANGWIVVACVTVVIADVHVENAYSFVMIVYRRIMPAYAPVVVDTLM